MAVEKKFIEEAITKYQVSNFLERELDRAGFSRLDVQRTPLVTRIAVEVMNPGRVIGKKGKSIQDLTDAIKLNFKIDNPQISVVETANPALEPRIIAKNVCRYIEMGKKLRAILHSALRDIMRAGAMGAEIVASGKIAAKGGRSKKLRVMSGFIPKSGEPARLVHEAHVTAYPKSGAIGVLVRILMPGTKLPGRGEIVKIEIPRVIAAAEDVANAPTITDEDRKAEQKKAELEASKHPPRRRK